VLTTLEPASALAIGLLIFSMILVMAFEATNGFHDAANAVATVIYTKSLKPFQAVLLSGVMNFIGVLVSGIAVAYALVELLPAEVLTPPSGGPAVAMLVALFITALLWNLATWAFSLPNSSSHCLIGSLIGIAVGNALIRSRDLADGVQWAQLWTVLEGLALSPVLGFILAGGLYFLTRKLLHDKHLYEPVGEKPPIWWMRAILITTCSGVSFAHGSNDGQKSIGLIMLTIIGLLPATFALNPEAAHALNDLPGIVKSAEPLIEHYGDDEKADAIAAAHRIEASSNGSLVHLAQIETPQSGLGPTSPAATQKSDIRGDVYQVISQMKHAEEASGISDADKKSAKEIRAKLGESVEYAPWWVRILSAVCLGLGTMVGYKRIVKTLGERLGKIHLTPAQGAATEIVSAILIGMAGATGLPVSTTHIVTSGIGGTMVASGAGLRVGMLYRIALAWIITLPVTVVAAAALYYLLANPGL
jgi:PiT family inorganic phosphate transporter